MTSWGNLNFREVEFPRSRISREVKFPGTSNFQGRQIFQTSKTSSKSNFREVKFPGSQITQKSNFPGSQISREVKFPGSLISQEVKYILLIYFDHTLLFDSVLSFVVYSEVCTAMNHPVVVGPNSNFRDNLFRNIS